MIDLMITLGAWAERRTMLTDRPFNDSQDCLTFLERQLEGLRRLRDCVLEPEWNDDVQRRPMLADLHARVRQLRQQPEQRMRDEPQDADELRCLRDDVRSIECHGILLDRYVHAHGVRPRIRQLRRRPHERLRDAAEYAAELRHLRQRVQQ